MLKNKTRKTIQFRCKITGYFKDNKRNFTLTDITLFHTLTFTHTINKIIKTRHTHTFIKPYLNV